MKLRFLLVKMVIVRSRKSHFFLSGKHSQVSGMNLLGLVQYFLIDLECFCLSML